MDSRTSRKHSDYAKQVAFGFSLHGHPAKVPPLRPVAQTFEREQGHVIGVENVSVTVSADRRAQPKDLLEAAQAAAAEDGKELAITVIERPRSESVLEDWAVMSFGSFLQLLDAANGADS